MPTVLRIGSYRFHFYSADGEEPPHIHVARHAKEAKFWLESVVLARNAGYKKPELRKVRAMIVKNRDFLLKAWDDFFGK
jgi:hypothetical protein